MGKDIQKAPEISLLKSEMEAAAARVAERAMNTTLDGVGGLVGDVFGGLIGDRVKQWRNRNLVTSLVKTKDHFDRLGIPIENAKALPMGELYAIFDGMSKQDDPQLTDMWAALLANAMNPAVNFVIDPILPKVLQQMSGVDAVILKFYNDAAIAREKLTKGKHGSAYAEAHRELQKFVEDRGHDVLKLFGEEITSSSISNLLRLGLFFVDGEFDDTKELVKVAVDRNSDVVISVAELQDELSNIYYHLKLASDNVDEHKVINHHMRDQQPVYFLPYDMTRLAKRLLKACSES